MRSFRPRITSSLIVETVEPMTSAIFILSPVLQAGRFASGHTCLGVLCELYHNSGLHDKFYRLFCKIHFLNPMALQAQSYVCSQPTDLLFTQNPRALP